MAYSVNWATKVITIPKADLTLIQASPEIRELNVTTLWQTLIDIQDDPDGIVNLDIVRNATPITVAGITLGRVVEIINGYTVTFENLQYSVNVVGGNSNISDVTNKNQVSVNTANSAGLVVVSGSPVSLTSAERSAIATTILGLADGIETNYSLKHTIRLMAAMLLGKSYGGPVNTVFRDINDAKDRVTTQADSNGNRSVMDYDAL